MTISFEIMNYTQKIVFPIIDRRVIITFVLLLIIISDDFKEFHTLSI